MEGQSWFDKTLANPAWWTQKDTKLFGPDVQDALLMLGGGVAGPESAVGRTAQGMLGLTQSRRASEAASAQRQQLMDLYQKLMQQLGIQGLAGQGQAGQVGQGAHAQVAFGDVSDITRGVMDIQKDLLQGR